MKMYASLFKQYKGQPLQDVFAHFYPVTSQPSGLPDYEEPFKAIAASTVDGYSAWEFQQQRFKTKYSNNAVPKLKNYLNYTFVRLNALEQAEPGKYFHFSKDREW